MAVTTSTAADGSGKGPTVEALVALGSNLGDRAQNLRRAVELMADRKLTIVAMSSVYETEPMYYERQGPFLNCVVVVRADATPQVLMLLLQSIESEMGRLRKAKYGPRVIDLDILLYGDRVVSAAELKIPHPLIAERPFVLVPLAEVRPGAVHPVLGKTAAEMLSDLGGRGGKVVKKPELLADLVARWPPRPSQPAPSPSRRGS